MWAWREPRKSAAVISAGSSVMAAPRCVRSVRWPSGVTREKHCPLGTAARLNREPSQPAATKLA